MERMSQLIALASNWIYISLCASWLGGLMKVPKGRNANWPREALIQGKVKPTRKLQIQFRLHVSVIAVAISCDAQPNESNAGGAGVMEHG